ncbi:SDR family NAD(P)-dependent oxidoreductase [Hydrogenophaga sp.]|uniref:SDR family NAD(P)-dependent oxidoreductase n=1 Tax=Hydrogenophaga sp. TaxID=1904254 RepID=UPI002722A7C9|nr:SDR family oxidoreductase [Hydrogenophaga sp.]MDO9504273.1 SDR family oxidoreductase [Hydrogenophaga sp.]
MDSPVAVVTGAASGIGEACARALAAAGHQVVLADRRFEDAQRVAVDIGGRAIAVDVAEEASVAAAAQAVMDAFGRVDILVNSAGVLQRTLPPGQLTMKEWDFVVRVDLRGTYLCCAEFGQRMAAGGGGAIVNIASVAGMRSGPLHAYGPAKAGVISLSECLAAEWGPSGVRVNTVSPGFTATPALSKGLDTHTLEEEHLKAATVLNRLVRADEIAAAVVFLASPAASAITGINLPVDCGYLVATPWASYGGLRRS